MGSANVDGALRIFERSRALMMILAGRPVAGGRRRSYVPSLVVAAAVGRLRRR